MRPPSPVVLAFVALAAVANASQSVPPAPEVADREQQFLALPSPENMRETMRLLTARPHHVGTAFGEENAKWILARFQEWGFDATIETFDVLYPTPKARIVEMLAPRRFKAALQEPTVPEDPTSGQHAEQLPTYNIYSIDGDVTGPLVYVNYGVPEDYERLERLGVSVKGAIVISRYGGSWRGVKPKVAAEHGAIACLIYSDPRNDGYFGDSVFPKGPMRPPFGVQRGSVLDFPSVSPGDPLTPGVGATPDAPRLPLAEVKSLTRIPVLSLSYRDAEPLLAALEGPMAPEEWRGALPISYHVGPGPARVHVAASFEWRRRPVHNVIARIAGTEQPDRWIIRGNHHDAWVNGAEDPISGLAPLLEEARAFGLLKKSGWRPRRTIVYCAWDGEEAGLLGSTEWGEAHAEELDRKAVAYINTDGNGRGVLSMAGSHTLEAFVNSVARAVQDPEAKIPVADRLRASSILTAGSADDRKRLRDRRDLPLQPLGSGSDYTVFLDHLGVASLNLAYSGEDDGGIYHSIYDDFYWYTHFSDRDFIYGRALAQTVGLAVLRLADAELLPFDFTGFADTMKRYQEELKTLLKKKQDDITESNRQLADGVFDATRDPRRPTSPPPKEDVPPHLNFAPLENALDTLGRGAERYKKAAAERAPQLSREALARVNDFLMRSERVLLSPEGLPRRPWFRHLVYAPGVYSGYGAKTMPGVREAIEEKRYAEADTEIARIAKVLVDEATLVDQAAVALEAVTP